MFKSKCPKKIGLHRVTAQFPLGTSRRKVRKIINKYMMPYQVSHLFAIEIDRVRAVVSRWSSEVKLYESKVTNKSFSDDLDVHSHWVTAWVNTEGKTKLDKVCEKKGYHSVSESRDTWITAAEIMNLGPAGTTAYKWVHKREECQACLDAYTLKITGVCDDCGHTQEGFAERVKTVAKQIEKGTHESCRATFAQDKVEEEAA